MYLSSNCTVDFKPEETKVLKPNIGNPTIKGIYQGYVFTRLLAIPTVCKSKTQHHNCLPYNNLKLLTLAMGPWSVPALSSSMFPLQLYPSLPPPHTRIDICRLGRRAVFVVSSLVIHWCSDI